jgi:hypothetical protein
MKKDHSIVICSTAVKQDNRIILVNGIFELLVASAGHIDKIEAALLYFPL